MDKQMLKISEIKSLKNSISNEIDLYRANKCSDFDDSSYALLALGVVIGLEIALGNGYSDKTMRKFIGKKSFRFLKKMWHRTIGTNIPHIKRKDIKPIKEKPIKYQTSEELSAENYKAYLMYDDDYRKSIGLNPLPPADPIIV